MQTQSSPLTVLLVDDEKEACKNLKNILLEYVDPDIIIKGIAHNTNEAEKMLSDIQPDAVFLDIEMPGEDAFQFLERIGPVNFEIVFVTAYDEYAIKAFKLNAIDYILKPISIAELKNAIVKLKERINYKKLYARQDSKEQLETLSEHFNSRTKPQKIIFKENSSIEIVDFRDILFLEAKGSYSKVYFTKDGVEKNVVMSHSIAEYEDLLPAHHFFRIHKSYLINCNYITRVLKEENLVAVIKDVHHLPIGRRRYSELIDFLRGKSLYKD